MKEIEEIMLLSLSSAEFDIYKPVLSSLDSDKSGTINYSEFISLCMQKSSLLSDQNLEITFKTLDYDNNGSLSLAELSKAFEFGGN